MKQNVTDADAPPVRKSPSTPESDLVQRVISTQAFTRSLLLTKFLLYICECKLSGREEEITEYQIGVQALGRADSYNPGDDNIVRNYARILRKRLEEYFAGEGRNETLRIVIPRGHYVPIFEPNSSESSDTPDQVEVQDSSAPSLAAKSTTLDAETTLRNNLRRLWIPIALLITICLLAIAYWFIKVRSAPAEDVFWKEIFDRSRPTYVVPGDSGFAMLQDITGTEVHLNDYISGDLEEKFPSFNLADPRSGGSFGPDRFSNYTSTADLSIALNVAGLAQTYKAQCNVRYARDLHMEDLKGSNVILIGGPHANPWDELFEPKSSFRMVFPMRLDGMHIDERSFINKHPKAGEQSIYANQAGDTSRRTYALISFLPGADGMGHVLLLEGQNMAGTRAAGDFLLNRQEMEPVLKKARLSDGSIGPFEVLLETRTVGANAPEANAVVERYGLSKTPE